MMKAEDRASKTLSALSSMVHAAARRGNKCRMTNRENADRSLSASA
jgi:hypothetical protein